MRRASAYQIEALLSRNDLTDKEVDDLLRLMSYKGHTVVIALPEYL